jgi:hypothetical protein
VIRFCHALRDNRKGSIPGTFVFVDTETRQRVSDVGAQLHTFKLGWACCWQRGRAKRPERIIWQKLSTSGDFWQFLERCVEPHRKHVIIAHNMPFDFCILGGFPAMHDLEYSEKMIYAGTGASILVFERDGCKVAWVDSLNYFKGRLADMGRAVGLPKGTIDFEHCTDAELSDYCHRDTEILLRFVRSYIAFIQSHDLGTFRYTIGGQALQGYRHRFMRCPIYIHDNTEALELERRGYYGGRSEAFYVGKSTGQTFHQLDVNSMYAYVMRECVFPYKLVRVLNDVPLDTLRRGVERDLVVADVGLHTTEPAYPYRYKGRLLFPVGDFDTTLTTPEVRYALEHGHLACCTKVAVYKPGVLFRDWVDSIYSLRKAARASGNTLYDELLKRLLNHLYGKFGQRCEEWALLDEAAELADGVYDFASTKTGRKGRFRYLGGRTWVLQGLYEASESFPAISAHVCAYARMHLWSLMLTAGREHVYYCDTDSLIVDGEGLRRLGSWVDASKLGYLKVEASSDTLNIFGVKDYVHGEKTRRKGIREAAQQVGPDSFVQEQWASLTGIINAGMAGEYVVKKVLKRLKRKYLKGVVQPGGRVRPYTFPSELLAFSDATSLA